MAPKLYKILSITVPSVMAGTIVIVPTAIAIAEANHEDPVPPEPPVEEMDITFNAGEGYFESTGTNTLTIKVKKGDKLGDLGVEKPVSGLHSFKTWSVNGQKIDDTYIFNEEVQVNAVYEDHIHTVDDYVIDEQEHKIYGYCNICHNRFELNEQQFEELKGAIFVKQDDKYELSTKSLDDIVAEAYGSSVDLYIVNGTYEMSSWSLDEHTVIVNMHGVLYYDNNTPKAIFRCVNIAGATSGIPAYYQWHGMTLNVDHIELLGLEQNLSQYGGSSWQNLGIQPATLNATNCYLKGCHSTHANGKATFTNCIFDSRGFKGVDGNPLAEYGLYTWNGNTEVYNSTFIGDGKTLKIYTDYHIITANQNFVVSGCTFIKEGTLSDKAAVEIDSSQIQGGFVYVVTIQNSTLDGVAKLWNDKGLNHEFPVEPS